MFRSLFAAILPALALLSQAASSQLSPAPAGLPPVPGAFTINNERQPGSLDPAYMRSRADLRLFMALYEGLVVVAQDGCSVEPGLAESWSASPDRKTYTFHLREARWSDGKVIQAQEVVDAWLRVLAPATKSRRASDLTALVEGAEAFHAGKGTREQVALSAPDARTFQVTFRKPAPSVPAQLTGPGFAVVPQEPIQAFGREWTRPEHFVGNGPFVLRQWEPEGAIVVEKNPRYWDASRVRLGRIAFEAIPDEAYAFERFKEGKLDWAPSIDAVQYPEIEGRPDYQRSTAAEVYYYKFNQGRKPFNDARVRRALSLALDREALCGQVLRHAHVLAGGLSEGSLRG